MKSERNESQNIWTSSWEIPQPLKNSGVGLLHCFYSTKSFLKNFAWKVGYTSLEIYPQFRMSNYNNLNGFEFSREKNIFSNRNKSKTAQSTEYGFSPRYPSYG